MKFVFKLSAQLFLVFSLMAGGLAIAQSEPSMGQIYVTVQAGKLDSAQAVLQQVLLTNRA